MSMIMQWDGVPADQAPALRDLDEDAFVDWLEDVDGRLSFDIDKAWHAVHFVLNGDPWSTEGELGGVVLGGEEFGEDIGYGPARMIDAAAVAELAGRMQRFDPAVFAERVDLAALHAADVYPGVWDRTDEDLVGYVVDGYTKVRDGFAEAAAAGLALVVSLN